MTKGWILVTALFVLIVVGTLILFIVPARTVNAPTTTATTTPVVNTQPLADTIVVDAPAPNAAATSPLSITGRARGTWYFEASAPVKILDAQGNVLGQGHITAQGDWMTTEFVPFTGTLTFPAQPAGSTGTLELTNDNPSGDPAKQKTLDIPVTF